jgi:hypothetical protein
MSRRDSSAGAVIGGLCSRSADSRVAVSLALPWRRSISARVRLASTSSGASASALIDGLGGGVEVAVGQLGGGQRHQHAAIARQDRQRLAVAIARRVEATAAPRLVAGAGPGQHHRARVGLVDAGALQDREQRGLALAEIGGRRGEHLADQRADVLGRELDHLQVAGVGRGDVAGGLLRLGQAVGRGDRPRRGGGGERLLRGGPLLLARLRPAQVQLRVGVAARGQRRQRRDRAGVVALDDVAHRGGLVDRRVAGAAGGRGLEQPPSEGRARLDVGALLDVRHQRGLAAMPSASACRLSSCSTSLAARAARRQCVSSLASAALRAVLRLRSRSAARVCCASHRLYITKPPAPTAPTPSTAASTSLVARGDSFDLAGPSLAAGRALGCAGASRRGTARSISSLLVAGARRSPPGDVDAPALNDTTRSDRRAGCSAAGDRRTG